MTDTTEKIKAKRTLSEKIASYIPGYRGYKEKELRREADKMVREKSVAALNGGRIAIKDVMAAIADSSRTDLFKTVNRVSAVYDRVTSEIEHADYGYAGFFDAVKVREEELDELLKYDHSLISKAEDTMKTSQDARDAAQTPDYDKTAIILQDLRKKLLDLEADYLNRKSVIMSV